MPNLAERCRRAHYRAWRRGTRELDLLLGGYASELLDPARITEDKLALFELLLEEKDGDIYDWIIGAAPKTQYQALILSVREFHAPNNE